jgi:hypothetical protein
MINILKDILVTWLVSRLEKEIAKLEKKLEKKRAALLKKLPQDEHSDVF